MNPKNKIYFQKINGKIPNGKRLEILVDGNSKEKLLIQPNIGTPITHVRVIDLNLLSKKTDSGLFDGNTAYPLKDPENYTDIMQKIEKAVRAEYSGYSILSRRPRIEIRTQ